MKRAVSLVAVLWFALLLWVGAAIAQGRPGGLPTPSQEFRVAYPTTFTRFTVGGLTTTLTGLVFVRNQSSEATLTITDVEIIDQATGTDVADLTRDDRPPGGGGIFCPFVATENPLPLTLQPLGALGAGRSAFGFAAFFCMQDTVVRKDQISIDPAGFLTILTIEADGPQAIGGGTGNNRVSVDAASGSFVGIARSSITRIILP